MEYNNMELLQELKGAHVEHTFNTTNFICNMVASAQKCVLCNMVILEG